jgi:hypothetical protein
MFRKKKEAPKEVAIPEPKSEIRPKLCSNYGYESLELRPVIVDGEDMNLCEQCISNYFTVCEKCGNYTTNLKIERLSTSICNKCL